MLLSRNLNNNNSGGAASRYRNDNCDQEFAILFENIKASPSTMLDSTNPKIVFERINSPPSTGFATSKSNIYDRLNKPQFKVISSAKPKTEFKKLNASSPALAISKPEIVFERINKSPPPIMATAQKIEFKKSNISPVLCTSKPEILFENINKPPALGIATIKSKIELEKLKINKPPALVLTNIKSKTECEKLKLNEKFNTFSPLVTTFKPKNLFKSSKPQTPVMAKDMPKIEYEKLNLSPVLVPSKPKLKKLKRLNEFSKPYMFNNIVFEEQDMLNKFYLGDALNSRSLTRKATKTVNDWLSRELTFMGVSKFSYTLLDNDNSYGLGKQCKEKLYECLLCSKKFAYVKILDRHLEKIHPVEFSIKNGVPNE